jgi:aminopeptidase YwaD
MTYMKKIAPIVCMLVLALAGCFRIKENPAITEKELMAHVEFLASDSLKGRLAGSAEDIKAARYIADEFQKAGIKWLIDKGLQEFEIVKSVEAGKNNILRFNDFSGIPGKDFEPTSFSSNDSLEADVLFCGYGFQIDQEDLKWNDYKGQGIAGKWIMILRGNPQPDMPASLFDKYSGDRDKAMVAKDNGAGGVIFVSGPLFDPYDDLISLKTKESSVGIPVIQVKREVADKILSRSGKTISTLEKNINSQLRSLTLNTGIQLKGSTEIVPLKAKTYNVAGYIEGSDPAKKNQWIVLGAHYDHLGLGGVGSTSRRPDTVAIHHGADDNASGVASLIEIAEKIALNKKPPERSFLFLAFGAEEMGLLGSKYFVDSSLIPLDSVSLMMNLDMVGRMKEGNLQVIGTGTSVEGEAILKGLAIKDSIKLSTSPEGFGASDQTSFYGKDIPVLFLTTGVHMDYHTPDDIAERINYPGMLKVDEFAFQILDTVSKMDSMLTFVESGPKTMPSPGAVRGRVTLGIMPDITSTDDSLGMRVEFVTPGKPADLGGLKKGDMILYIDGKPVNNVYDYMFRLQKLTRGQHVIVTVGRNGKNIDLLIQL